MALSFDRSRPGFWLSALAHGSLLAAGLLAFAVEKLPDSEEGIPVEMITDNQVSEITRGQTDAAAVQPTPKPRVDRQAETRVERAPGEAKTDAPAPPKRPVDAKVADEDVEPAPVPPKRPEIAKAEPPPPPARPDTSKADAAKAEAAKAEAAAAKAEAAAAKAVKLALREDAEEKAAADKARLDAKARAESKAKAEADAKAAAAKADAKAKAEADAKADLDRKIKEAEAKEAAEADAKAKAEQRRKLAEAKTKADAKAKAEAEAKARRQAEAADKFSPGDISKLLNNKAPSQSTGSTGSEVQRTASLGTATGTAARLNPSQRDQIAGVIREQLIRCWQPPIAVQSVAKPPTAVVRLDLRQDGSLAAEPSVVNSSSDPLFGAVRDSALRATRRCAPLRIPSQFAPFYQDWKDLVVDFDPKEMG